MLDNPVILAACHIGPSAATARRRCEMPNTVAVICVATCRRPKLLLRTLASVVNQTSQTPFAVVVVDNDPVASEGASISDLFFLAGVLRGRCVIEAEPGKCFAINRALQEARYRYPSASYILMIDDDEVAEAEWLDRMIGACQTKGVDIVGGPVVPEFPRNSSDICCRHPVYWPVFLRSGYVPTLFCSGNFLIRKEALERLDSPHFDEGFSILGGGDIEFFARCRRSGMTFYWEQQACIVKVVPRSRVNASWVLRRGLRIGAINYRIDSSESHASAGALNLFAKNAALIPVSLFLAVKSQARGESLLAVMYPLAVVVGRFLEAFGLGGQYGIIAGNRAKRSPKCGIALRFVATIERRMRRMLVSERSVRANKA